MARDYDAPRSNEEDSAARGFETLAPRPESSTVIDLDEVDLADSYELPGGDLSGEELAVEVLPAQADEFTCSSCFLVRHRSQLARQDGALMYCTDCEG
ncbi:DUF4193 domain-containing protein [Arthrobacter sp. A2-55]|uniref:DUF4193 domain-containing protein n=1 Tax=Arthrobacter sp. A2-55 TaxID=2897337 RepID=UPI0021CD921C|nr:DUF4193 domain-containing protein [Arthrobacter sp. A2-55]MCU6481577.1 DUF4193 domain-containing protein [Arthrobacter sp. A2-55]